VLKLADGNELGLAKPEQFVGYTIGSDNALASILLCHNELHCQIIIDPTDPIGATHRAGVKDIVLESAVTTIMDLEDSVSAVDAVDKAQCYRNWAGLVMGDLSTVMVSRPMLRVWCSWPISHRWAGGTLWHR
jgi:malate synthase